MSKLTTKDIREYHRIKNAEPVFVTLEKEGVWHCVEEQTHVLNVIGHAKGNYYTFECQVTPHGWYVTVIRNGTNRGAFQGSTFNLWLEIQAAWQRIG